MSCKICGKTSCTTSFHSLIEQEIFDGVEERVKSRILASLERKSIWVKSDTGEVLLCVKIEDINSVLE